MNAILLIIGENKCKFQTLLIVLQINHYLLSLNYLLHLNLQENKLTTEIAAAVKKSLHADSSEEFLELVCFTKLNHK